MELLAVRREARLAYETPLTCNVNQVVMIISCATHDGRGDDRADALYEPSMQPDTKGPARLR